MTIPTARPQIETPWSAEREQELRNLWDASPRLSCSEIAAVMGGGLTRNAVIGKAHRLKLKARKTHRNAAYPAHRKPWSQESRDRASRNAKMRSEARRVRSEVVKRDLKPIRIPKPVPPPIVEPPVARVGAWEALPGSEPIGLMHLTAHTCRWPIGERPVRFCGCPVRHGEVYCPEHQRLSVGRGSSMERAALSMARSAVKREREYA